MMTNIQNKFFQILRCAINVDIDVPKLSVSEWKQIYGIAQKQSLVAVIFPVLERATPPSDDDAEKDYLCKENELVTCYGNYYGTCLS